MSNKDEIVRDGVQKVMDIFESKQIDPHDVMTILASTTAIMLITHTGTVTGRNEAIDAFVGVIRNFIAANQDFFKKN